VPKKSPWQTIVTRARHRARPTPLTARCVEQAFNVRGRDHQGFTAFELVDAGTQAARDGFDCGDERRVGRARRRQHGQGRPRQGERGDRPPARLERHF
jgi:hypothetical protein